MALQCSNVNIKFEWLGNVCNLCFQEIFIVLATNSKAHNEEKWKLNNTSVDPSDNIPNTHTPYNINEQNVINLTIKIIVQIIIIKLKICLNRVPKPNFNIILAEFLFIEP